MHCVYANIYVHTIVYGYLLLNVANYNLKLTLSEAFSVVVILAVIIIVILAVIILAVIIIVILAVIIIEEVICQYLLVG